jgi:hypothetical protein
MRTQRVGDMYSSSGYDEYCAGYNIVASDGTEVVGCEGIIDADPNNAAFIVKAVNSHEALVDALPRAEQMLRIAASIIRKHAGDATTTYDGAKCDGYCVADDCETEALIIASALSAIEKGEEA